MPKDKTTGKKLADLMYGSPDSPAFGVYPMIAKRREDRQDREAAKNFPVDLGRGAFAGAAGLAGDMESLGRLPYVLYTGNESPTFFPTSEEILKRLPYGSDSPVGQLASGLGTLAGGSVPFGVIPKVVKAGAKGVMAAGRAGERMAEKYVPKIMERGGAGADILSGMAQGTRSQMFIGPNAKTFNKAKADSAIELEAAGVDPVDIWRQTGTFRGADGIMRQEISDAGAIYRNPEQLKELGSEKKEQALALKQRLVTPIGQKDMFPKALTEAKKPAREEIKRLREEADVLGRYSDVRGQPAKFVYEHPELYKAYPELADVQIYQGGRGTMGERASVRGSGSDVEMEITQEGLRNNPKSSILHEMQHGIQGLEGMAPGGNTVTAFRNPEAFKILGDMRLKANTPMSFEDFLKKGEYPDDSDTLARAAEEYKDYVDDVPMLAKKYDQDTQRTAAMEYYKRLAGEAEARASQAREPMGMAERGQEFPYSSYDVLPEDLIVKPAKDMAHGGAVHMQAGGIAKGLKALIKTPQKAVPIVEAPSIMIPSRVGRVKEEARQSKGEYGARRVERAADEIKNLERLYKERALREAFLGDNAKAVMTMSPADFERYAKKLQDVSSIGPKAAELAKQGDISKGTVPTDEYIQHLMRVQGGFDDMPYLIINKEEQGLPLVPFISGHEGRHRSRAMAASGEPSSLVQLSPRSELREPFPRRSQEEYLEALRKELEMTDNMVLPEGLERPPIKLPDVYAAGGRVHISDNPDVMALELAGGGKVGMLTEGIKAAAKALKPAKEAAVPLQIPRARPTPKEIADAAERVGRQQAGEFVTNPLSGKTTNLAGRSKKEVERLKNMEYKVSPIKDLPEMKPYQAKVGEVNIALPGDQTISDMLLESADEIPIGSTSEGGALFGRGRLSDPEETRAFWASNFGPADMFQRKVTELARLYDTDEVTAYHLAMGSMSNNFAQHLADAGLRATDFSKLSASKMRAFDGVMREGYIDPISKKRIAFPNWPGIAFPEESLQVMKEDPLLRKWYNNRMKTPAVTQELDLPNAKSIEYAMTEPELRNMEINLTGLSAGRMKPGADLIADSLHNTYDYDIPGTAVGRAPELAPFSISFPDVTSFVREKYRPQDFTGTIQKVFPHQIVDEAYLDDMQKYYEQLRKVRGFNEGGEVSAAASIDGNEFVLAAQKYGLDDSNSTLNKIVSLVNQGASVDEAARIVAESTVRFSDNPDTMALELAGGGKVGAVTNLVKGLFSAVDKTAQNLKRPAGTGKEFMAEVKATPGVKATELKGRKLAEIEAMPKMTKQQFIKELEARPPIKIEEKVLGQPSQQDIDALVDKLAYEKGLNEAREYSRYGDDIDAMAEENYRLSLKHDKDELEEKAREMLSEGDSGPFHEKYAIPGGENYREILLKAPAAEGKGFPGVPQHFGGEPNILASIRVSDRMVPTYTPEQAESIGQRIAQGINVANPKSLASGAPEMAVKRGIVTPLEAAQYSDYRGYRNNDLTGAREKVLHVEEIQSDWHQAGRKARTDEIKRLVDSGMSKQEAQAAVPEDYGYSTNMAARRQELGDRYKSGELSLDQYDYLDRELTSVPDAPFKKDWQELALRKVMELASEGGYDKVALTPGVEQASRYDLSKQLSEVMFDPKTGSLSGRDHQGKLVVAQNGVNPNNLADYIGKEGAEKILQAPADEAGVHALRDADLSFGGEGMKSFYDKMLPDYLNKLGKQYGVEVSPMTIDHVTEAGTKYQVPAPRRTSELHGFEMTPQMREDINTKGQPLYSKIGIPGAEAAGAATIGAEIYGGDNEQQVQNPIQFTENPDEMRLELMQRN
jgi:hypothetical protein